MKVPVRDPVQASAEGPGTSGDDASALREWASRGLSAVRRSSGGRRSRERPGSGFEVGSSFGPSDGAEPSGPYSTSHQMLCQGSSPAAGRRSYLLVRRAAAIPQTHLLISPA